MQLQKTKTTEKKKPGRPIGSTKKATKNLLAKKPTIPDQKSGQETLKDSLNGSEKSENKNACPKCGVVFRIPSLQDMHNKACGFENIAQVTSEASAAAYVPEFSAADVENLKTQFEVSKDMPPEVLAIALASLFEFLAEKVNPVWKASAKECNMLVAGWKPVLDHYFKSSNNQMWLGAFLAGGVFIVPRVIAHANDRRRSEGSSSNSGPIRERQDNAIKANAKE
jgi:hypothetical protein